MIVDLSRFLREERVFWTELEGILDRLERDAALRLTVEEAERLHYLYERAASDLAKVSTFAFDPVLRQYLQILVGRAYGHVHGAGRRSFIRGLGGWFMRTFPQTFRRHLLAFYVAIGVFMLGALFGAGVIMYDYEAKAVLMPFPHLLGDPSERVAWEESREADDAGAMRTTFSATLMTHNTRVSIVALALGMTFGIGTIILLFSNGVILGAVACDYILAGEGIFLLGWLLPHGSVEIPAILLAGQAGLMIGHVLIGWGTAETLAVRFRRIRPDLVTLIGGVAILLVWAGIIEAFISQYHQPVIVYSLKIAFGLAELGLLTLFLMRAGRDPISSRRSPGNHA